MGFMAARDGKVFAEGWWTPYGPERIHCNHSLGKSYTAAAIGILYTQRKLKLEERVVDLFADELRQYGIEPDENMKKLTVYHVLTMTNGMARHPIMDAEWLKNYLAEPGSRGTWNGIPLQFLRFLSAWCYREEKDR